MVVVTVELWPFGDETKKRPLGRVEIENDATGDADRGNYVVRLAHAGRFFGKPGWWKTGGVKGFARHLSPYHLLLGALAAALRPLGHAKGAAEPIIAWLESYEERAAILEFDGGVSREEAERQALTLVGPPPTRGATA